MLGIDVGTTGTKTLLMDTAGALLGSAYQGYESTHGRPDTCEQNPADWWDAVAATVREAVGSPERARRVAAVSLSTQGGTLVPADRNGEPVCPAIVWNDTRCGEEMRAFGARFGEDYLYRVSGWSLQPGLNAMQIAWLRKNDRALFERAELFLSVPDYIAMKLTGKAVIDPSNAGINQLMSLERKDWEDEILDYLGITRRRLPKIADSGAVIGTLQPSAAQALGLPEDVLVAAGGHDQYCAALGAGAVDGGDILVASGTAWVVTAISEEPRFDNPAHPNQSLHTVPGKWGALLSLESGGVCLEWLRKKLSALRAGAPLSLKEIDEGAAQCPAGSNGALFYPYITPATYPPEAEGCPSTLLGLTITQDGFAVARAVMEGVVYQVLWMLEAFGERPEGGLVLTGGAAKSALWTQILADAAGVPVLVPGIADTACVGAAVLAGIGAGLFRDARQGSRAMASQTRAVYPNERNRPVYEQGYRRFKSTLRALQACYRE